MSHPAVVYDPTAFERARKKRAKRAARLNTKKRLLFDVPYTYQLVTSDGDTTSTLRFVVPGTVRVEFKSKVFTFSGDLANVLKEVYKPTIAELLFNDSALFKLLENK